MKKTAISVTEAARNFADLVNRVHYQHISFVLLKNGKRVGQLVPVTEKVCTGRGLAEAIGRAGLSAEEAQGWHKDLAAARKGLTTVKYRP